MPLGDGAAHLGAFYLFLFLRCLDRAFLDDGLIGVIELEFVIFRQLITVKEF